MAPRSPRDGAFVKRGPWWARSAGSSRSSVSLLSVGSATTIAVLTAPEAGKSAFHFALPRLLREGLRWAAHHSGIPLLVVAAVALVISFRVVKWSFRFLLEVTIALAFVVFATTMGWISW